MLAFHSLLILSLLLMYPTATICPTIYVPWSIPQAMFVLKAVLLLCFLQLGRKESMEEIDRTAQLSLKFNNKSFLDVHLYHTGA